jgi:imidazolonepropionase-like amidohydrolase
MKHLSATLALAFLAGNLCAAARDTLPGPLAITGVTVVDVTGGPSLPDRTVVVDGIRITAVGKAGVVRIPRGAQVVDGRGQFLIPGLWDMHVHTAGRSYLPLYVANGVTGVRDMHAFVPETIYQMRREVRDGKTLGPRIVAAGPVVDGPKPFWPGSLVAGNAEEGRKAVRALKQQGADFVKVYTKLPRDAYLAIADEAKKQGLSFAGHVPESVSAAEASDLGQKSIEHVTGIALACSEQEDKLRREEVEAMAKADNAAVVALMRRTQARAADSYNEKKAQALYARFVRNRTWQVPTLTVLRAMGSLGDPRFTADGRVKYMSTYIRSFWDRKLPPDVAAVLKQGYKRATRTVRAMHQAGVPLLAGTDVTNPYVFPGFSLHDELALLVSEGGLTPLEALQAATRNPARFLGMENDLGAVQQGKLADLVLLQADPLKDITNTRKIAAVVVNGKLLSREALDSMLAEIEAANKK